MAKRQIENATISSFSLRSCVSALLYSEIFGPCPIIKRYSPDDWKNMKEYGVVETGLKEGEFVVIRRTIKLV